MRHIGIHFGHDSGIVVINEEGEIEQFILSERLSRNKNQGDFESLYKAFPNLGQLRNDDHCVMVSIGGENATIDPFWQALENISTDQCDYHPRLIRNFQPKKPNNFVTEVLGRNPNMTINHHLCHIISAWCFRETDDTRMFAAYDGCGLDTLGKPHSSLVGEIGLNHFNLYENAKVIPSSVPLTSLLGYNSAGKAMGLAGYITQELNSEQLLEKIIEFTVGSPYYTPRYPEVTDYQNLTQDKMEFVASFYKWYTQFIWKAVEHNITNFAKGRGIVIGGGTTLALELNTKIAEMCTDVVFSPCTDDSGLALGAAAFSYYHHTGKWPKLRTASLNDLQSPLPKIGPQKPEEIADLLHQGKIIGLLRGKAEVGPRALGFRSILGSAQNPNNLPLISQEIKGREFYRPLAPMVTNEEFDRFFIGPKGKYMQYRVQCTTEAQKLLPAIVHADNSARPQVVFKDHDPWLHELLVCYGNRSGTECLINTSLNGKNRPICNTFEDAQSDMEGKDIELISIADNGRRLFL